MADIDSIVAAVKDAVSGYQCGEALGLSPDSSGRCACPIHNGRDRNMKLWKDDSRYYCHVCHAKGDAISLVRAVNQCSFWNAVEWLNSAFNLGLPLDRPMDKNAAEAARIAQERRRMEREQQRRIEREKFDHYVDAVKRIGDLESDLEQYRPTKPDQPWDERFCAALRTLPEAKDTAERLAVEVIGTKNA